jgi:hypothetical protein
MSDITAPAAITQRVKALKDKFAVRDLKALTVKNVKAGEWERVAPGAFTEDYPAPMVANRIEVMSRDVSASLAPLPAINCAASSSLSDAAKKFAEKRSKIANAYIKGSHLESGQTDAAACYNDFGMLVYFLEPDLDAKMPRIRVRDSSSVYAEFGPDGRAVRVAEEFCLSGRQVEDQFPGSAAYLRKHGKDGDKTVTVTRYSDGKTGTVVYLPECDNYVLLQHESLVPGRPQYVCVLRPGAVNGRPRGAYDDLVYPQIADHEFRMLQLEGASKAVQAPLAVPSDVTDIPYGPDAVIRSQQPQNIRRVATEIPNSAFQASQMIREDLAVGGMSPESRTGNIQASVITGKGIEAASAGYSSQIANAQIMIAFALEQAIEACFLMDEHLWGDVTKEIRGVEQGSPFTMKYKPSKDIDGDHTVEISYGFLSGMAPNNALVFVLQAQAAGLISRDFAARQLPVGMNVNEEFHKIDIETMRNSLMQGMSALAQSLPGMVQNGMDPTAIVKALADIVRGKQKGKQIEDVISDVFAPKPPPPAPGSEQAAVSDSAAAPGGAGGGSPLTPEGLQQGLATEGPNGRPDLSQLFAGVGPNGQAQLGGQVSRMNPVQGQ